ncbi:MAG: methylated-DNA--[protein]-cysteine S-methyltransferase [Promethearchaeota archaeon]
MRCVNFALYYFKSEILDIYILILYNNLKNSRKIQLNGIKFFKTENNLINFINKEFAHQHGKIIQESTTKIQLLVNLIYDYFSGIKLDLYNKINELDFEIDLIKLFPTDFSRKVIKKLLKIGYGVTTTYSEIGHSIGSKAYRAIGNVLKKNPLPIIIPCHRVINKNGDIGGYMGSKNNNWQLNIKKELLKIEGSIFTKKR